MSKNVNSPLDNEARASEREARSAKADMEQLVQELAALPADARATIRGRIESGRNRLEAIAAQAEQALADRRDDVAEAAYEAHRHSLENARSWAKDGLELKVESLGRYSRALEEGN